jgi:hypothetical protein
MRNDKYTQYRNRLNMGAMLFALTAAIGGGLLPPPHRLRKGKMKSALIW